MSRWIEVPSAGGVRDGEVRPVAVEGRGLVFARCEGVLRAVEDRCSHDDGPLGEGALAGCDVVCPRHGARFDLRDGRATRMPAVRGIRSVPVREDGGRVLVDAEAL
jgi:3-phenylpropionate/trans-cinnamate dioxygenase ferredoxin subunit